MCRMIFGLLADGDETRPDKRPVSQRINSSRADASDAKLIERV